MIAMDKLCLPESQLPLEFCSGHNANKAVKSELGVSDTALPPQNAEELQLQSCRNQLLRWFPQALCQPSLGVSVLTTILLPKGMHRRTSTEKPFAPGSLSVEYAL